MTDIGTVAISGAGLAGAEYAGYAPVWDRVVFRGEPASRESSRSGSSMAESWPA